MATELILHFCRYKPTPEDQILRAFQVLDADNKGYLTQEELTKYMTEEGECKVFNKGQIIWYCSKPSEIMCIVIFNYVWTFLVFYLRKLMRLLKGKNKCDILQTCLHESTKVELKANCIGSILRVIRISIESQPTFFGKCMDGLHLWTSKLAQVITLY